MPNAIIVQNKELKYVEVPYVKPKAGEVRIRHTAIGVNFIDVYHRTGLYPLAAPFIPGVEAVGYVEEVGPGVEGYNVNDKVIYGTSPNAGGYSTHNNIHQDLLIKVPFDINEESLLSLFMKGMTVHMLLCRVYYVMPENTILVHAAAGGVGTYICQWASYTGAKIIGTVSSDAKAKWAKDNGCTYTINTKTEDVVKRVMEITNGRGVPVVYDAVGQATFQQSIDCLAPMGLFVSYGQASGPIPPVDLSTFAKKSLFFTRPSVFNYKSDRKEFVLTAIELMEGMRQNMLKPRIGARFALKDAAEAHKALENRQTMGSIILIPPK